MTLADMLAVLWRWPWSWLRYCTRRPVYVPVPVDVLPDGQQGEIARDEDPGHLALLETRIVNLESIPGMLTAEHDAFGAIILVSYNETEMWGLWQSPAVQAMRAAGEWLE